MSDEKVQRANKLVRNVKHDLWTKTVKRARREEGLEVNALIEKLFTRYNQERDAARVEPVETTEESPVQVLD